MWCHGSLCHDKELFILFTLRHMSYLRWVHKATLIYLGWSWRHTRCQRWSSLCVNGLVFLVFLNLQRFFTHASHTLLIACQLSSFPWSSKLLCTWSFHQWIVMVYFLIIHSMKRIEFNSMTALGDDKIPITTSKHTDTEIRNGNIWKCDKLIKQRWSFNYWKLFVPANGVQSDQRMRASQHMYQKKKQMFTERNIVRNMNG